MLRKNKQVFLMLYLAFSLFYFGNSEAMAQSSDYYEITNTLASQRDVTLHSNRVYNIDKTIVVSGNQSLTVPASTTIQYNGSDFAAIKLETGATLLGDGTLTNLTNGGYWNTSSARTGIWISSTNIRVQFGYINNFEYGAYFWGNNVGSAYNRAEIRGISNSIHAVKLEATGIKGYVNQNFVHVDLISIWSDWLARNYSLYSTTYGIYIDSHSEHAPNVNRFSGNISGTYNGIRLCGNYNRIEGMRLAVSASGKKIMLANFSGLTPSNVGSKGLTAWNWWFSEYGYINWNTEVGVETTYPSNLDYPPGKTLADQKRKAIQPFGVRGLGLWAEQLRVAGNAYCAGSWTENASETDIYAKNDKDKTIHHPLQSILKLEGTQNIFETAEENSKASESKTDTTYSLSVVSLRSQLPALVRQQDSAWHTNYNGVVPVVVEAVKEQQTHIQHNDTLIDKLTGQLAALNIQAQKLEQALQVMALDTFNTPTPARLSFSANPVTQKQPAVVFHRLPAPVNNASLMLCTIQGGIIKQYSLKKAQDITTIPTSNIEPGLYLVMLLSDEILYEQRYLIISEK